MKFDFYADLASANACPTTGPLPAGLASGFVDGCTVFATRGADHKNSARDCYSKRAQADELRLPRELNLDANSPQPLKNNWVALRIGFTLCAPWYSKDDRSFHVLDNPVRKDRVFAAPYMSAASWKGLLRWACRMQEGLPEHLPKHLERTGGRFDGWNDPDWVTHLFGNDKEQGEFQRAALAFRPTWFSKIGFEVINPHSRKTRAGTQPITYEVVPVGTPGTLDLLYAPLPDSPMSANIDRADVLQKLLDSAEQLLTVYGFSAKRTSGWGIAKITSCELVTRTTNKNTKTVADMKTAIGTLFQPEYR